MSVLSIDLAARRYRDIGIALLDGTPERARIKLVDAEKEEAKK